jgi:non-homologous end joining protein Ku
MLVESTFAPELNLSGYHDTYTDKLREIAQAKVQGQQILKPAEMPLPPTFNLIDALRKSLAKTKKTKAAPKLAPTVPSLPLPKRPRKAV